MSINKLIDANMRCSKCGIKGVGKCGCWPKTRLVCTVCGNTKICSREEGEGEVTETEGCPRCEKD